MKSILGWDLGNQNFRLVLGTQTKDFKPQILAVLERPSGGLTKGAVVDYEEFVQAADRVLEELKSLGYSPKHIFINVAGPHSNIKVTKGMIGVSRADNEISEFDIEQLIQKCQEVNLTHNKTILHIIPREYAVDDLRGIKDPVGMHGIKLELESVLVEGFLPNIKTISKAFNELKKKVETMVFTPLAGSRSSLSKKQQEVGVALVDLGAESTSLAVFEDGKLLTANSFPIGANHITHDLAIISEHAERVAVMYAGRIMELAPTDKLFKNTRHPYTIGLIKSMPEKKGISLKPIAGFIPSPGSYPSGCKFSDRCELATGECRVKEPELVKIAEDHFARCVKALK